MPANENSPAVPRGASLRSRAIRQLVSAVVILGAVLLLSAGSVHFWEAWLFVGLQAVFWSFFFIDFLKSDPELVERRLQRDETEPQQKVFRNVFWLFLFAGLIVAGLDFRHGWTLRWWAGVPLALALAGQAGVVAGYWIVYRVMRENSFAASTVRVESEQRVIDSGPYELVRHPMYSGMSVVALAMPVALGSYVAIPLFAMLIPTLAYRLIHEERLLRRDLPGYVEYCERTRFRLLPGVW